MIKKLFLFLLIFIFSMSVIYGEDNERIVNENDIWSLKYLNKYVDGGFSNIAKVYYKPTGEIAFCIEPEVLMKPSSNYYIENNSSLSTNIAKIIKAYKNTSQSDDLYIAAQLLIWNELGIYKKVDSKDAYDYGAQEIIDNMSTLSKSYHPNMKCEKTYSINESIIINDDANILSKGYYIESYSKGLSDIKIIDNHLEFIINDIYPVNKEIVIKPKSFLNNILTEDFVIYLADGSQSLVSYRGNINDHYEGIKLNFKHKTGDLIIHKYDEYMNLVEDDTYFRIYQLDENDNKIKEILREDGTFFMTNNGILEIKNILPLGRYIVEEYETSYKYINKNDSFIVEISEDKTINVDFINENRNLQYSICKTDDDNIYYLNDVGFTLYDISDNLDLSRDLIQTGTIKEFINEDCVIQKGENYYQTDELYLIKKNIKILLNKIFSLNNNQLILNDDNELLDNDYVFNEIGSMNLKSVELIENQFKTKNNYFKGNILMDKPLDEIEIYDIENNKIIAKLDKYCFEKEDVNIIRYCFKYKDEIYYLLLDGYLDNSIDVKDSLRPIFVKMIDDFNVYIINNDETIINEPFKKIEGLKLAKLYTGQNNIQIVNPHKHNYPLINEEITLYSDSELNNEIYKGITDELGHIKINGYDKLYYKLNDEIIELSLAKKDGYFIYPYLKQNRKYLLIEDKPLDTYTYKDNNICHLINTYNINEDINVVEEKISNTVKKIDIELYKTNSKLLKRLDGAIFEIYLKNNYQNEVFVDKEMQQNDELEYIGKYESGALNINKNEFDIEEGVNYQFEIYNDEKFEELVKIIPYIEDEYIINDLKEGVYYIVLRKCDSNEIINIKEKEVAEGKIFLSGIPMNKEVVLKEIKAPTSYYYEDQYERIKLSDYDIRYTLPYYRINQMIIVNTACYE